MMYPSTRAVGVGIGVRWRRSPIVDPELSEQFLRALSTEFPEESQLEGFREIGHEDYVDAEIVAPSANSDGTPAQDAPLHLDRMRFFIVYLQGDQLAPESELDVVQYFESALRREQARVAELRVLNTVDLARSVDALTGLVATDPAGPLSVASIPRTQSSHDVVSSPVSWVDKQTRDQPMDDTDAPSRRSDTRIEAVASPKTKTTLAKAFRVGDIVRVHLRVGDGLQARSQGFEGVVVSLAEDGESPTFTVRRVSFGAKEERTFVLGAPNTDRVDLVRRGDIRRAKLYYLRALRGKAAKAHVTRPNRDNGQNS